MIDFREGERVQADQMWRNVEIRKRFESECGLQGKDGVAEHDADYGERFNQWALRQIRDLEKLETERAAIIAEAPAQTELPPNPYSPTNDALARVDLLIMKTNLTPDQQMGVLIMATVLAMRRFLAVNDVDDRPRRMRIIKEAVRQFDAKLREFVKSK